jgi:hypothetical protein
VCWSPRHSGKRFSPRRPILAARSGADVFVSDNPDEQILEDAGGKPLQGCVISTDTARV